MNDEIKLTVDELKELYLFMEKANELFHQPMNYKDKDILEKFATEQYPTIRKLYYDMLWEKLPQHEKNKIIDS